MALLMAKPSASPKRPKERAQFATRRAEVEHILSLEPKLRNHDDLDERPLFILNNSCRPWLLAVHVTDVDAVNRTRTCNRMHASTPRTSIRVQAHS